MTQLCRLSILLLAGAACVACAVGEAPVDDEGVDDTAPTQLDPSSGAFATAGHAARVVGTGGLGLRLRALPNSTSTILLVMPEGDTVDVLEGPTNSWFRVDYDGTTGWAHGGYLQKIQQGGVNNLLPWAAYTAFRVSQGHNGGSHVGAGAWAWDFATPIGTPILAAHLGTVRLVKGNSNFGGCSSAYANDANFVIVDQGNGFESLYLHLASVTVTQGQAIARGDLLGYSGQTGWSCGPHLHFQIQRSPGGGGGFGFYNQSIHDYFYDYGAAWDPTFGTLAESRNGVADVARTHEAEQDVPVDAIDPHGDGEAWDRAMSEASVRVVELVDDKPTTRW